MLLIISLAQTTMYYYRLSLIDLYWKEIYIVNMTLEICLETGADCYPFVEVLKQTVLPKAPCNWNSSHEITG